MAGGIFLSPALHISSAGLRDNQWQLEAQNLHNLTIASLQRMVLEFASPLILTLKNGKTSVDYLYLDTQQDTLCGVINMRNGAYASFSVLGLSITIALIIVANFVLSNVSLNARGMPKLNSASTEVDRS
jgi:hypothetical protein